MFFNVTINDHGDKTKAEINAALNRALERIGEAAEGYAVDLCPVDTGRLQGSITHTVKKGEKAAYIGTNVEYAPYVELGTGAHYTGGRDTPWTYRDDEGGFHRTGGQKAQPFLRPAAANHKGTYANIVKDELGG